MPESTEMYPPIDPDHAQKNWDLLNGRLDEAVLLMRQTWDADAKIWSLSPEVAGLIVKIYTEDKAAIGLLHAAITRLANTHPSPVA